MHPFKKTDYSKYLFNLIRLHNKGQRPKVKWNEAERLCGCRSTTGGDRKISGTTVERIFCVCEYNFAETSHALVHSAEHLSAHHQRPLAPLVPFQSFTSFCITCTNCHSPQRLCLTLLSSTHHTEISLLQSEMVSFWDIYLLHYFCPRLESLHSFSSGRPKGGNT